MHQPRPSKRYRCTYTPASPAGFIHPSESGTLPHIEVEAPDAETAARKAHQLKACPIVEVTRLDDAAPSIAPRARTARPAAAPTGPARVLLAAAMLLAAQAQA